jgi:hypothetical protein
MTVEPLTCACCGETLHDDHIAWNITLPQPIAELGRRQMDARITTQTDMLLVARGVGNFFRVILPIPMDTGREATVGVWISVGPADVDRVISAAHGPGEEWGKLSYSGVIANGVEPWAGIYRAPATVAVIGQDSAEDGVLKVPRVVASEHPLLHRVLTESWPEREFLRARREPAKGLLARLLGR